MEEPETIKEKTEDIEEFIKEQKSKRIELYDWQNRAIKYFFNNNYKAIFEVTTGAGKTFFAIEIIKKILETEPYIQVLIVVPKNVILETGWYKELYDAGISIKDIGVYYGNIKEYAKFTITNIQNLENINFELFNMIIFDEIHNMYTTRLMEYLKKPFTYKIGLSATIEGRDDKHWKMVEYFDYNIFKYEPKQALDDGILNPFNFINIAVEMDQNTYDKYTLLTQQINTILQAAGGYYKIMKSSSGTKYKLLSMMNKRKDMVNNYPKKFKIVRDICDRHKEEKIIVFNEYNEQTNKTYWHLLETGMKTCIVHSGIKKQRIDQNLIDFKNDKYNVMLTSKVLDEGYNLPKIDVAIISAGNSTAKQTIQRMGRVLRKKNKPSILYQIYCKKTIEEEYALERSKIFKELCTEYKEEVIIDE